VVMTSPGVIYKDLIIVGFRTSEAAPAPHGDIRAFDVHTGQLRWSFHTIPHPGEEGYDTWPKDAWKTVGSANNWPGMVLDAKRGVVYAPTGSPVSDFYGADRIGNGLYGDTLLALDANTGRRLWHFQGVHHDVWDRDFPSPPVLLTLHKDGREVEALAQTTKQGYLYVFDRVSGNPLFPIEERPYPASNVPGEQTSPTQPYPTAPEPFARQQLTADMITQRTPAAHQKALQQFKELRSGGQFVPFSVDKQTVVFPGFDGGAEWGGPAVDPKTGVLYVNANDVPWTGGLTENTIAASPGAEIYQSSCASCHGDERRGSPPAFPSLVGITSRLTDAQITTTIQNGRGRMPSFPSISEGRLDLLLAYLKTDAPEVPRVGASVVKTQPAVTDAHGAPAAVISSGKRELENEETDGPRARYRFTGYRRFQDIDGYPAVVPPWGTLNAIDLNTGKYLWKIPLGEYPELAAHGAKPTGTENYGGPVVTAGGILFIGATMFDDRIRAFDSSTGKLLWEYKLPFAGVATPAVYMVDGKEYVVIAASGGRNPREPAGGDYVAFALP
jgi:quinoprotein glucose dehydrogenase